MPARLFCKTGELAGQAFAIDREATVGRLRQNEITLASALVSARQARIYFDEAEGCYFLEDLGSRNGTRLDGVPVAEPTRLAGLHVLTFAEHIDFVFQVLPASAQLTPQWAGADEETTRIGQELPPLPDALKHPAEQRPAEQRPAEQRLAGPPGDRTTVGDPFADINIPALKDTNPKERTRVGDAFGSFPPLDLPGRASDRPEPPVPKPEPPVPKPEPSAALEEAAERAPEDGPEAPPPMESALDVGEETETISIIRRMPSPEELFGKAPEAEPEVEDEAMTEEQPVEVPALAVSLPGGTTRTFALHAGANVIGRDPACDVSIPEASISRRHAVLTVSAGGCHIRDLGSKNGTLVNALEADQTTPVRPGDVVRLGLLIELSLTSPG